MRVSLFTTLGSKRGESPNFVSLLEDVTLFEPRCCSPATSLTEPRSLRSFWAPRIAVSAIVSLRRRATHSSKKLGREGQHIASFATMVFWRNNMKNRENQQECMGKTLGKPLETVGWCGISSGFPAEKVSKDPRVPCPRCPIQGGKLSCGAARSRFCGMTYDLKWLMTTYIM